MRLIYQLPQYIKDYLVTWNCTHLANGENIKKLVAINKSLNIHTPIICTPEWLAEETKSE